MDRPHYEQKKIKGKQTATIQKHYKRVASFNYAHLDFNFKQLAIVYQNDAKRKDTH